MQAKKKSTDLPAWLIDEESETDERPTDIKRNSKGIPEEIANSFDNSVFVEKKQLKNQGKELFLLEPS